ncbi:MAG: nitronate monooxygenase [Candidatus Azotimanducaceae bacterium]|jgi:nitronate monooxygenase
MDMWQSKRIQSLLNIAHPIVHAPMAGASSAEMVAAVSNAGCLGSFGASPLSVDQLRSTIQKIRSLTSKPFNINLFASSTEDIDHAAPMGADYKALLAGYHKELGLGELPTPRPIFGPAESQLQVLIEEKVPVISFHFGIEAHQVAAIHDAGLKVLCSATTVEEALHLDQLGVDAIIAQGTEAGGHRGTFIGPSEQALIGTLALVPQIVDRVSVPVIAAGGIMDGRSIVACAALGASAAQMGTAFLGCAETPLVDIWRQKLSAASASDTLVTRAISGKPARGLRNRYITEVESLKENLLPYPLHYSMSGPLRSAAIKTSNADFLGMWSGQGVGLFRSMPAAALITTLIEEIAEVRRQLAAD